MTKKTGWKIKERDELISLIVSAKRNDVSLSTIFQDFAKIHGRKPNSVRNYYYSLIDKKESGSIPFELSKSKFVSFSTSECDELLRSILSQCAKGLSVRKAILTIAKNKTHAIRLQNKYRNLLKNDKERVNRIMEEQKATGRYYNPFEKAIVLLNVPVKKDIHSFSLPLQDTVKSLQD